MLPTDIILLLSLTIPTHHSQLLGNSTTSISTAPVPPPLFPILSSTSQPIPTPPPFSTMHTSTKTHTNVTWRKPEYIIIKNRFVKQIVYTCIILGKTYIIQFNSILFFHFQQNIQSNSKQI